MSRRTPEPALVAPFDGVDAAVAEIAAAADAVAAPGPQAKHWQHVAGVFGRLVAQGVGDHGAALAAMKAAAAERLPGMDAMGREVRMAWLLNQAVEQWQQARDRARFAVRRALGPLLAERAPSGALMTAARAVNAEAGWPLTEREVLGVVRNEVFWAARRAAKVRVG